MNRKELHGLTPNTIPIIIEITNAKIWANALNQLAFFNNELLLGF